MLKVRILIKFSINSQRLDESNKETERFMGKLRILQKISAEIASPLELKHILESVAGHIDTLLEADRSLFLLIDIQKHCLIEKIGPKYPPEYIDNLTFEEIEQGLSGKVMKTKKALFVEDAQKHPDNTEKALESAKLHGTGSVIVAPLAAKPLIVAPLAAKGECIGTLTAVRKAGKSFFTNDDKKLACMLANHVTIAIQNARQVKELKDRDRRNKELVKELEERANKLKEANREIAEKEELLTRSIIASDFVHNLNNLAGTIPVWTNSLKEKTEDLIFEIQRDVNKLLREGERLKKPAQEEKIDMNTLLQSLLNNVSIQYAETEIKKEISDELYPVRGVKPYLSNAVYNVILNGIESVLGKKTGTVTVKAGNYTENSQDWVRIEITDTGKGVSEKDMEEYLNMTSA